MPCATTAGSRICATPSMANACCRLRDAAVWYLPEVAVLAPAPRRRPLTRSFYRRPADRVARALLGKRLWCGDRAGLIVETEAYLGPEDLASHARFGPGGRSG